MNWTANKLSLKMKLLLSYALIIVVPLTLLGVLLYALATSITEQQVEENRSMEMRLLSGRLEEVLNHIEVFSRIIFTDDVQQLLNAGPPEDPIALTRWKIRLFEALDRWYGYMGTPVAIQNISILTADGRMFSKEPIYAEDSFIDEDWYQEALSLYGNVHVAGPFERQFRFPGRQANPHTFAVVRKINNTMGQKDLGGIVIDLHVRTLEQLLNSSDLEHVTIVARDNRVVYSSDAAMIGRVWQQASLIPASGSRWAEIEGQRVFVNSVQFPASGWRFVTIDSLHKLREPSVLYRNVTAAAGVLAALLALALSVYFARKILQPIHELGRQMKEVQHGNFDISIPVRSQDEIGQLTGSFNRMTQEIQRLIHDVYLSELRRKEAELKTLHAQINPHFLYNTLDSMNAIAAIEQVPQLSKMTTVLADMFRYSISAGEEMVPLAEELEQVRRYMDIQQIRYDNRFWLVLDVPEKLLSYRIPKLTIQPIVENALYHGLEMSEDEEGNIVIRGEILADKVRLVVRDNGAGMTQDTLQRLRERLSQWESDTDHIGLANVQERLSLHFGNGFGIAIDSKPGQGTTVTYTLPGLHED